MRQDLHLAKRYYDQAVGAAAGAWLPVKLALWALWVHSGWLKVAPALPRYLGWLRSYVFVLSVPAQGAARRLSLGRAARAPDTGSLMLLRLKDARA